MYDRIDLLKAFWRCLVNYFEKAKWIWIDKNAECDEHAEFIDEVYFDGSGAEMYISADSDYAVYVNGSLAAFGQYPDFPYMKVYDRLDLSRHMRRGKNVIAIRVWYYGIDTTSTYYPGDAGLIYSLYADGVLLSYSSERTLSRISPTYVSHKRRIITGQLGLSFEYDAEGLDAWMLGEADTKYPFSPSRELDISPAMRQRTCKKTEFGRTRIGKIVSGRGITPVSDGGMIFDLGSEVVGFICLKLTAKTPCDITVAFGEHLVDGCVRRLVGGRNFSFIYHATEGVNYFMSPLRRFGCRFVELITDGELSEVEVSMRPVMYPVNDLDAPENLTYTEQRIYDACVYTLKCCMHEHYEDCPWREQALYTMDSRNQMLTGYYAFGEYLFPKANLELISEDNRADGLLSICYPMIFELAIPSFSLHFVTECEEYLRYSGDRDFIAKIYPKIKKTLDVFLKRIDTCGLIAPLSDPGMWNFYEWCDGLDGVNPRNAFEKERENLEYDLVLNSLLSIAISRMMNINESLGYDSGELLAIRDKLNFAIHTHFFDEKRKMLRTRATTKHYSKLANSLAILAGVLTHREADHIAKEMTSAEDLVPVSLSMKCFFYDALLSVNKEQYAPYILADIEKTYKPMLEVGNGTVWETELGESDFDDAGSLCHGWSSIPIYYYNLLK